MFAVGSKGTFPALGISGGTNLSAEPDDPVTKIRTFLRRQDFTQLSLYFFWLFALGKTKPAANANAVGVANNAAGNRI